MPVTLRRRLGGMRAIDLLALVFELDMQPSGLQQAGSLQLASRERLIDLLTQPAAAEALEAQLKRRLNLKEPSSRR